MNDKLGKQISPSDVLALALEPQDTSSDLTRTLIIIGHYHVERWKAEQDAAIAARDDGKDEAAAEAAGTAARAAFDNAYTGRSLQSTTDKADDLFDETCAVAIAAATIESFDKEPDFLSRRWWRALGDATIGGVTGNAAFILLAVLIFFLFAQCSNSGNLADFLRGIADDIDPPTEEVAPDSGQEPAQDAPAGNSDASEGEA